VDFGGGGGGPQDGDINLLAPELFFF